METDNYNHPSAVAYRDKQFQERQRRSAIAKRAAETRRKNKVEKRVAWAKKVNQERRTKQQAKWSQLAKEAASIFFENDLPNDKPLSQLILEAIEKSHGITPSYSEIQTKADNEDYAMTQADIDQFNKPLIP